MSEPVHSSHAPHAPRHASRHGAHAHSPHAPHLPRIGRRRRWALYAVFALLLGSGALWGLAHLLWPEPEAQAPWLAASMKVHGALAQAALFLVGMLWMPHIRQAWQRRRNRLAGGVFAGAMALLVLTGWALYYINGEALRGAAEWVHWVAGGALALLFWVHRHVGRGGALAAGGVHSPRP